MREIRSILPVLHYDETGTEQRFVVDTLIQSVHRHALRRPSALTLVPALGGQAAAESKPDTDICEVLICELFEGGRFRLAGDSSCSGARRVRLHVAASSKFIHWRFHHGGDLFGHLTAPEAVFFLL